MLTSAKPPKHNVLILYCNYVYPLRATLRDLLYCFGKYSGQRVFYLNLALGGIPFYFKFIKFDIIIFHTLFLNANWVPARFKKLLKKVERLTEDPAVKIALPQDEFYNPKALCQFINRFGIKHVFSVQPEREWQNIYRDVDFSKVHFHRVLTAYMDGDVLNKISQRKRRLAGRDITIGYRSLGDTNKNFAWYGRHGRLKVTIADRVQEVALKRGIKCDISYQVKDTIIGDNWYWFLLRCKYVLGIEGGTSILDWDGSLHKKTGEYVERYPEADFEEIEQNCFPGLDGSFRGFAISPRHLEACATQSCQILTEGEYNGILKPNVHYIEMKKDFSNLDAVIELIQRDDQREEITKRAYEEVVASGKYTYEGFTKFVSETVLGDSVNSRTDHSEGFWARTAYHWTRLTDRMKRVLLFISYQGYKFFRE